MPLKPALAVMLALGIGANRTTAQSPWVQWTGNGHYYRAVYRPSGITWAQARAQARALGGDLATITSSAENAFVFGLVRDASYWKRASNPTRILGPWLGGYQPPGSAEPRSGWSWVNGEPWSYSNWSTGEPNNWQGHEEDQLQFFTLGTTPAGRWNDLTETSLMRGFLVEAESIHQCPEPRRVIAIRHTDRQPLGRSSVLFSGESLRLLIAFRARIDDVRDLEGCIEMRSFNYTTDPEIWIPITIDSNDRMQNATIAELQVSWSELVLLGLAPVSQSDLIAEHASADSADVSTGRSNRLDSDAFVEGVQPLAPQSRASARGRRGVIAPGLTYEYPTSADFIRSGGVRFIDVRVGSVHIDPPFLLQDQADVFYFSGHGDSRTGEIRSGSVSVSPEQVRWSGDVEVAIIAGCAVLDIGNRNNLLRLSTSPGLLWANTGPTLLLGYNYIAPFDDNAGNPGYTAAIIDGYFARGSSDPVMAWAAANASMAAPLPYQIGPATRPYNCCAIDLRPSNPQDHLYWYYDLSSGTPTWVSVPRSQW
jgi:hypothetical protein